jgi:DNA-binding MarR family transcriptional regulator
MNKPKPNICTPQAVLAAIERAGSCTLPELSAQFPALAPSAIKRVVDALVGKGLVQATGNPFWVYLRGVCYAPTPHGHTSTTAEAR